MTTIQDLLNKFPISKDNDVKTLRAHAGLREYNGHRIKYFSPTGITRNNVITLLHTIYEFNRNPQATKLAQIEALITTLRMDGVRSQEDPNCILFYSNDPARIGCTFYCYPAAAISTAPERFVIPSHEHCGSDNDDFAALKILRRLKPEFMPVNTVWHELSGLRSRCQGSRDLADVAHSIDPVYFNMMKTFVDMFPNYPVIDIHGMSGTGHKKDKRTGRMINFRRETRVIVVNNYGSQFLHNGQRSWPLLFAIALAQFDVPVHTIAFASDLPGFVIAGDGVRRRMGFDSKTDKTSYFASFSGAQNTNVPGHVANGGACDRGRQIDHSFHLELGPEYRTGTPGGIMNRLIDAMTLGLYFWHNYIPAKHDPWKVPGEVFQNFRLYPAYFTRMLHSPEVQTIASRATPELLAASVSSGSVIDLEDEDLEIDIMDNPEEFAIFNGIDPEATTSAAAMSADGSMFMDSGAASSSSGAMMSSSSAAAASSSSAAATSSSSSSTAPMFFAWPGTNTTTSSSAPGFMPPLPPGQPPSGPSSANEPDVKRNRLA